MNRRRKELIAQLPDLGLIAVLGVGYDGVDVASARAQGAQVTHTPGVLNDEVADLALAITVATARRLPRPIACSREAAGPPGHIRWPQGERRPPRHSGSWPYRYRGRAPCRGVRHGDSANHNRRPRPDVPYAYVGSLLVQLARSWTSS